MKIHTLTAAAAAALLMGTASASALTYASSVTPEGGSEVINRVTNSKNTTDAGNALGAPTEHDTIGNSTEGFFSLGLGKYADFTFGTSFTGAGEGKLFEVTNGNVNGWPEFAEIFVYNSKLFQSTPDTRSVDFVAAIRNDDAQSGASFNFNGTWDTLRILDVTVTECDNGTSLNCISSAALDADGFDIDAVGVDGLASGQQTSPVPLPGAAWLLLTASGALIAAARRKSCKAA